MFLHEYRFAQACFVSLTWTMAPRDANVDTLSSKISGVQSKMRGKMAALWIHIGLPPKKKEETLHDLV